jgi:hypothetical protein
MKSRLILAPFGAALLAAAACSDNNNGTPPLTGAVRVANGITDSGGLDMSISQVGTFSGVGFDTSSGITVGPEGSYKAQLTSSSVGFSVDNVKVDHNNVTSVFAYGATGNGSENGFTAEESLNAPTNGQAVVQPVHDAFQLSTTTTSLNFYFVPTTTVCAVGAPQPGGTPQTIAFGPVNTGQSTAITGGTQAIIVSNGATILFCSGSKGLALPSGNANVYQVAALDATTSQKTQYGSVISLLLMDNTGGHQTLFNGQN